MDPLLLALELLGLAGSIACIVSGAYLLRHPEKRPKLKLPALPKHEHEEKPDDFLTIIAKVDQETKQE